MAGVPCPGCGGQVVGAVHGGSYVNRCPECRTNFGCTSWMAVAPRWTERVAFYREGAEATGPVLVGAPAEVWERVWALTAGGGYLLIRPADAEPDGVIARDAHGSVGERTVPRTRSKAGDH